MNNYFSNEKINTGRQLEVDVLKAICIIGMVTIHVFDDCIDNGDNSFEFLQNVLGMIIGAAGFMLCMGIGMRYTRNQSPQAYLTRGIAILTVGQLLNILRNALPNLIAYWITQDQWFVANSFLVFQADILSFAGLAFILMAVMRKFKLSNRAILCIAIAMNLISWLVHYKVTMPENYIVNQILGYFVITRAESYFPLFSYFVFVAAGFTIGTLLPYIKDKQKLYTRIIVICVPLCTVYYLFRMNYNVSFMPVYISDENYSLYPGPDAIVSVLTSVAAMACFYMLSHWAGDRIPRWVAHMSENINSYYCISYMFILPVQTLLMAVNGHLLMTDSVGTIYTILVLVACWLIIEFNKKYIHFSPTALLTKKTVGPVMMVSIWVISFAIAIYAYPRIDEFVNIWNDYLLP